MPDWLTQRNHAPDRDTATVDGWHELQVANPTFLLERLGSECTDLQGLRESARPRQAPIQPPTDERNLPPDTPTTAPTASRRRTAADAAAAAAPGERPQEALPEPPAEDPDDEELSHPTVSLPDVAWISARDGSRATGDLEDQAARYHPGRHELTINADFRAITDLTTHWQARYRGVAGAHAVIDAQVREWCEQILVEVVLAVRTSSWTPEQLDALLSPSSFTAAVLPRHLLHATLQKRLGQKLGTSRSGPAGLPLGLPERTDHAR